MASGPEIRMESSKINLIAQLLAAAMSLLHDLTSPPPSLEIPRNPHSSSSKRHRKRHRTTASNGTEVEAGQDHDNHQDSVVPIGPLLRSPIDPQPVDPHKEYDLNFVAQYLKRSVQTVRKWIIEGDLAAEKDGTGRGKWLITGEELLRFSNASSTIGDDQ